MAYSHIQLISYEIYTGPTQAPQGQRVYQGMSSDLDDMAYRVTLMLEAIECARRAAHKDATCLKVFVAPEFYFRGSKGAYPIAKVVGESRGELAKHNLLDMLRTIVKTGNKDYEHWLFVFGTIIASSEAPGMIHEGSQREAYNICLIHRGEQGIEGSRVVVKEYKSAIDFLQISPGNGAVLDSAVRHLMAGKKTGTGWTPNRGAGKELSKKEYEGLGIFEIEGITFGVEICLDHATSRLRMSPPGPNDPWVQIQIISSCGMQINPPSVIACKDGLVFNVDGSYTLKAVDEKPERVGFHSQLKQVVTPFTTGGNATLKKVTTPVSNPPHAAASRITPVFDDLSKLSITWNSCKPMVRVFPKLEIPEQPKTDRPDAFAPPAPKAPWEKDSDHASCQRCGTKFTWTTRRHHCRACGRVLCSTCAPQNQTLRLTHLGYKDPVRVCHDCYFQYTGKLKR